MGNTGSASSGVHLHLTGSGTVKGVFGVTSAKFDMVKWVAGQQASEKATSKKTVEPPVAAKKEKPNAIVPEESPKPSRTMWELLKGMLGDQTPGEVCNCCGQSVK
jgi:hypothetical protein